MTKTEYFLNEPLDTTGLVLDILYSDGTGRSLDAGFTTHGFDPETAGQQTLTITCEGLTVTCQVQVTKLLPGDLTADRNINSLDGLLLMRHLNGWDVEIAAPDAMDVNGDGTVNSLDGLILMRYLNGWDITLE